MTCCKTLAEVRAAARDDAKGDPPLTQDTADLAAAILAPHLPAGKDAAA